MEFIPLNELEAALLAATANPDARPRFYEILSNSNLLVIDESPGPATIDGPQVLEAGRSLSIRSLDISGVPHVPVFSSSERISAIVRSEVKTIAMNAKDLFKILGGGHAILNPGSDCGKAFTPHEMAQIVDGSIFAPRSVEVVTEARELLMGQPASYPTHITTPLAAFFKTKKEVVAAYLAHVCDPKSGEAPHSLIGVEMHAGADVQRVMGEASIVLESVAQKGEMIDLILVTSGGVSDYMTKETKPFYKKKRLGFF